MMGMVQNGCFAITVALGTIGVVLFPSLPVTLNSNSPSNVPPKAVGSNNINWDFSSETCPKLDLHLNLKPDKNYDAVFILRIGPKVKFSKKGHKKTKCSASQSHIKQKNPQYPAEKWEEAFALRARNSNLSPDVKKWTLDRISEKTGIPRPTLGHRFDETKPTRKGKGHIAGGWRQWKVLTTSKRDFLTITATETFITNTNTPTNLITLYLIFP